MLLYGTMQNMDYMAHQLIRCKAKFEAPDIQPKQQYVDPIAYFHQKNAATVPNDQHKILDQAKKQIEELYKSFTSPQNLEEMDQESRLISPLFKYQKQGLHWMWTHEQVQHGDNITFWRKLNRKWQNILTETTVDVKPVGFRGGILADDMGLGKTIQIISLILKSQPTGLCSYSKDTEPVEHVKDPFGFIPRDKLPKPENPHPETAKIPSKSTLIICPLSLIHNWQDQLEMHTKKGSLSVLVHHGSLRTTDAPDIAKFDVVITTYNIIGMGYGKTLSPLHKIYWYRIVLDEAHIIKTPTTIQAKAIFDLRGEIKWCLTGTPIQNKLDGNFSLIRLVQFGQVHQDISSR